MHADPHKKDYYNYNSDGDIQKSEEENNHNMIKSS